MKDLRFLGRLLWVFEGIHVAGLAWCLSLPLLFVIPEFSEPVELLCALGAALPVLAVYVLCQALHKPLHRLLASAAALLLTVLLCPTTMLRVVYGLCGVLRLLVGLVLPRPGGRQVLSVPKLWHAPLLMLLYAFSKIEGSRVMELGVLTITLLLILNYLLHVNTSRLLKTLSERGEDAVSDRGLLAQNRRQVLLFALLSAAVIVAVPVLLSRSPEQPEQTAPEQVQTVPVETEQATVPTVPPEPTGTYMPPGEALEVKPVTDGLAWLLIVFYLCGLGLAVFAFIRWLLQISGGRKKRAAPQSETYAVEALPEEKHVRRRFEAEEGGWDRRIRRSYARLILSRAGKRGGLAVRTPRELEQAAALGDTQALAQLHALYEKARYSAAACTHEDYRSARAAVQAIRKGESDS